MAPWHLTLALDRRADRAVFLQIADAIVHDIRRGRLRPGDRLPGSRPLARMLGVQRLTVIAALDELQAQGWITTSPARGTFVSDDLPETEPARAARDAVPSRGLPARVPYALPPTPPAERPLLIRPGMLIFSYSRPDIRLVPADVIARAYRRALRRHGAAVLNYNPPEGQPRLRAALATMLGAMRGVVCEAESVLVTRGSQMALVLAAQTLFRPGDVVAVEALGYRPAWEAFRRAGARIVPVPIDHQGIDVPALEALMDREPVRAVSLTPHHQFPTTVTLSPARRMALMALVRARRIPIIEDDYDHEFHYDGRPVLPLASADRDGLVVYVGTLSKVLAPGLRLGFLVAPRAFIERAAAHRSYIDSHGDHGVELAVAELLDDGEAQRHIRRVRRVYEGRRDLLAALLREALGGAVSFSVPAGGAAMWLTVAPDIDVEAWTAACERREVGIHPGRLFTIDDRSIPHLRLAFTTLNERELKEAVTRMAAVLPEARVQAKGRRAAGPRRQA